VIDEILILLGKAAGIAGPLIQDHQAKRHDQDLENRLEKYQDIISQPNPDERANGVRGFTQQLCLDSGYPARQPLSGTSIEIPVEVFDSLVRGQCELIKVKGVLNDAVYAANHKDS
jgi:hypothetical protein